MLSDQQWNEVRDCVNRVCNRESDYIIFSVGRVTREAGHAIVLRMEPTGLVDLEPWDGSTYLDPEDTRYLPHGKVMRRCPICHLNVWDNYDRTTEEITTANYGEHFVREHPGP